MPEDYDEISLSLKVVGTLRVPFFETIIILNSSRHSPCTVTKMDYIIGIDGGGTKTVGMLTTDKGEEVAKTQTGPSNYHVVGIEQTKSVLVEIIRKLTENVDKTELDSIRFCLGMAGLGREDDRKIIGQLCDEIGIGKKRILTHDAHIALVGGTGQQQGVIVISGTGSIVYGIDQFGQEARAGGWGYLLGDEGSGYEIGIMGLQAVARSADKREPPTELTGMMLNKLALKKPSDIIQWIHSASRDEIAELSKVVFKAVEIGDKIAETIIDSAAEELILAIETVVRMLNFTDTFDVLLSGGNLIHQPILADKLSQWIERNIMGATATLPKHEPVYGAVLLARTLQ